MILCRNRAKNRSGYTNAKMHILLLLPVRSDLINDSCVDKLWLQDHPCN